MRNDALLGLGLALLSCGAIAAKLEIPGPPGSSRFGTTVAIVKHGNIVVVDPGWPDGQSLGSVRMYSPQGDLLGSFNGEGTRKVGHGGIFVLNNGNFVVLSIHAEFPGCHFSRTGAATWIDVDGGLPATLTATNSLTCMNADEPDELTAVPLRNGNFVMKSESEVAWGSAASGLPTGIATTANTFRTTWNTSIHPLANGNFVVVSPGWPPGGAVTLGNGLTGLVGEPSLSNSLVGVANQDNLGSGGVTELANGDLVVSSPYWDNAGQTDAGAVTWMDGTTGLAGVVSASNSLVGVTAGDHVGEVVALSNGNYVVTSSDWDDWTTVTAGIGAVTWGNGNQAGGTTGIVSPANSLIGVQYQYIAGDRSVKVLANGNYVVESVYGISHDYYAATWGDGNAGVTGTIGPGNSLIGTSDSASITPLSNGNYVFADAHWVNPAWVNDDDDPPQQQSRAVGAVMLADGTQPAAGGIVAADSLVGNGYGNPAYTGGAMAGVVALDDGNYAVCTADFRVDGKSGTPTSLGAVTWGDGIVGAKGVVSASNSMIGASSGDSICYMDSYPYQSLVPMPGGRYLIRSPRWSNGAASNAGAVTLMQGGGQQSGIVDSSNSFVGTSINERVGSNANPVVVLDDGNYVLGNPKWTQGGTIPGAGSVTFGNGAVGGVGSISAQNSLVGTATNDGVGGGGVIPLAEGHYLVKSPFWHDAAGLTVGAITLGSSLADIHGPVPSERSVIGEVANQGPAMSHAFDAQHLRLVVGQPMANKVTLLDADASGLFADGFE